MAWKKRKNSRRRRRFSYRFKLLCIGAAGVAALGVGIGIAAALLTGTDSPQAGPVSAASAEPEPDPGIIVAIDPGHGGTDLGAEGYCTESEITAWTAQALYDLLEADERFTPVLTKDYDDYASVDDRAQAVNEMEAELLVSIHCNSDVYDSSSGFECYALPPSWEGHAESVSLAQSIVSAVSGSTSLRIRGENGVRYMYFSASGDRQVADFSDQTAYGAETFGLLDRVDCPAVLIEQFFVTSSEDNRNFGSESGCAELAQCYYEGICSYLGLDDGTEDLPTGVASIAG